MMQVSQTATASAYGAPDKATSTPEDINRKQRWFKAYESNKRREMAEQRQARQYYHDRQWTDAEIQRLAQRGQQATVRNRIKRKIDFLVGVEQRLRRDPKAYPRTPKHESDADVATAGLRFACDLNRWEKTSSEAMHDGLVSGIGVAFVATNGQDPQIKYVPVDRFFYDPRSVLPDFSDARYMGLHLWLDVDEAIERWPQHAKRLEAMVDASSVSHGLQHDADKEQQWGDFEARRVRLAEFWEKRQNGWYYCYFTGQLELESGLSPYLDEKGRPDCPYEAWSPYIDERGDRYGMVRTMRSVQDEINYSASKILHRIATDRIFYEEGAIDDIDEAGRQLARPDGKLKITRGEWGKTVGIIDQTMKLQGETERFQMAVSEIENLGPNPGLVGQGQGVDGASGRALSMQRDSGMTELSSVFERHRDWKLRVYRKLWQRCQQTWTAERWIRITDESKSVQFVGLNQYQMVPGPDGMPTIEAQNVVAQIDVDIVLDEGPDSITVNEEVLDQFTKLGEAALGPLGKIVITLSNTPKKDMLLKMIDDAMAQMAPGVDPTIEQKTREHEAKMAEMQLSAQIEQTKAALEVEKTKVLTQLQIEKQQVDIAAAQQKMQMEQEASEIRVAESRAKIVMQREADEERFLRDQEAKRPVTDQFAPTV